MIGQEVSWRLVAGKEAVRRSKRGPPGVSPAGRVGCVSYIRGIDMKVVYIAGPYRSKTEYGVHEHIRDAERSAVEVWRAGAVALCPHKNSGYLSGVVAEDVFLQGDLELLRRCDAVLLIGAWWTSEGTLAEKRTAERLGLPVFRCVELLRAWLARAGGDWAGRDPGPTEQTPNATPKAHNRPLGRSTSPPCPVSLETRKRRSTATRRASIPL